jgi:hypothetical protein
MGGACSMRGEMGIEYNILVGKPEGKRLFGRPSHRWKDIKIYLRQTELEVVNCIHEAQDQDQWQTLVNTVIKLWVP